VSSGMLRRVALVRTDVSEEPSASFIRVTRIRELVTTLTATSNRHTLLVFLRSVRRLLVAVSVVTSSPILVTLIKETLGSSETRFLQEPHGVTSQKTPFFTVTTVKTSSLTLWINGCRVVSVAEPTEPLISVFYHYLHCDYLF
jgi:hypothetical protein